MKEICSKVGTTLGVGRMGWMGSLLSVWSVANRPLLTIVLVLVGMCGNGNGKYMEGEMITGDNWIFMARLKTIVL